MGQLDEEREKLESNGGNDSIEKLEAFLTRLRISERLIREHGTVTEEPEKVEAGEVGGFFEPEAGGFEVEAGGFEHEGGRI